MNAITFDTLSIVGRDHLVTREYLNQRLETLELRLTMRLGTMLVGFGGVLIAIKYLG